ncbi:hypothetical protein ES703_124198 [subsurface metagenome]
MINTVHLGIGPLGQIMVKYAVERGCFNILGAVDTDPDKAGKELGELCGIEPLGENIRNQIREAGADTSRIIWWNTDNDRSKHSTDKKGTICNGINFTYSGSGVLPSDTTYYRGNSAARLLEPGDFDFDELFGKEGVRVFNTGGILMRQFEVSRLKWH